MSNACLLPPRDQSIITGEGGGAQNVRGGWQVRFYPYKKSGGRQGFCHAEGVGGTTSLEVVLTQEPY